MQKAEAIAPVNKKHGSRAGPAARISVSVVVPAFNEEAGIGAQLEGIERVMVGSGRPYELIVVDDGSTDRTVDCAAR
jgi:glycosyltransferase involved in cell wall biosynthesis